MLTQCWALSMSGLVAAPGSVTWPALPVPLEGRYPVALPDGPARNDTHMGMGVRKGLYTATSIWHQLVVRAWRHVHVLPGMHVSCLMSRPWAHCHVV